MVLIILKGQRKTKVGGKKIKRQKDGIKPDRQMSSCFCAKEREGLDWWQNAQRDLVRNVREGNDNDVCCTV